MGRAIPYSILCPEASSSEIRDFSSDFNEERKVDQLEWHKKIRGSKEASLDLTHLHVNTRFVFALVIAT